MLLKHTFLGRGLSLTRAICCMLPLGRPLLAHLIGLHALFMASVYDNFLGCGSLWFLYHPLDVLREGYACVMTLLVEITKNLFHCLGRTFSRDRFSRSHHQETNNLLFILNQSSTKWRVDSISSAELDDP